MHRILLPTLLAISTLAALLYAQERATGNRPAQGTAKVQTFTGSNVDGIVQTALNEALQRAHLALTKEVADAQFRWKLESISGTRGGITGSQAVDVTIQILP